MTEKAVGQVAHPLFTSWSVKGVDEDTSGSATWVCQLVVNDEDLTQGCYSEDAGETNQKHEPDAPAGGI